MSGFLTALPAAAYWLAFGCLALIGLHRCVLLVLYARVRRRAPRAAHHTPEADWPAVTVQLPLFNELHVAGRLIDAVCALDYPRDRLEIQVLDDSTDETTAIVTRRVRERRAAGVDIVHLRREGRGARRGFKAGALAEGLARARGELVAVLDADFVPPPSFLRRAVPHFADPTVAAVQTRWGHTNRAASLLTRVQGLLLDGHFLIEHTARSRSGRFFNFNGTCGVWRAAAIRAAGGWQHDTLTEDLDLSYRAQLGGWRFVYLVDEICPGELPDEMGALKTQQFRWAKGSVETGRKLLPAVWRAALPLPVKLESTYHLLNNLVYLVMAIPVFLALPLALTVRPHALARQIEIYIVFFTLATFTVAAYYAVTARLSGHGLGRGIALAPAVMALCVGLIVNNGRAVAEALVGRRSGFVRTPKYALGRERVPRARRRYRPERSAGTRLELAVAAYLCVSALVAWDRHLYAEVPALVLFAAGFLWVGGASLREERAAVARAAAA